MIFGKDSTKTSAALATESSVYVWSRTQIVLVHIVHSQSYCSFKGQKSFFLHYFETLLYTCTAISIPKISFLTVFDTFLTFFDRQTDHPTDRQMRGDIEAPLTEHEK